jgi:hypothetical protein
MTNKITFNYDSGCKVNIGNISIEEIAKLFCDDKKRAVQVDIKRVGDVQYMSITFGKTPKNKNKINKLKFVDFQEACSGRSPFALFDWLIGNNYVSNFYEE